MRSVSTLVAAAVFVLSPAALLSQGLYITNYQVVSQVVATATQLKVTYRADLVNPGVPLPSVIATLTTLNPFSVRTLPGQDSLTFPFVRANGQVTSTGTFTVLVSTTQPFSFSNLQWSFQIPPGPVPNPGPNQTVGVGTLVKLDGSGSTDANNAGRLTYSWQFTSRPAGTHAVLIGTGSVNPTFVADIQGDFVIALTVSDSVASNTASVTISTINSAPVANAGPNQTVPLGSTVILNASNSSDVDGDALAYKWSLQSKPLGSTAGLTSNTAVSPSFLVDQLGTYVAQLTVSDGHGNSSSTNVTITTQNSPPVANAGPAQVVAAGSLVQLSGFSSTDVDGDPLRYQWNLMSVPVGSLAALNNANSVNATFIADIPGTYVAQLIVNDGHSNSAPATVSITTNSTPPPTANAGPNQTVVHGATVQLSGSGTDPQNGTLTFQWSLISKPASSTAVLSSTTVPNPTLVADLPGSYVAQLIVNNGLQNSVPSTVTISTTNTPPEANAGAAQTVGTGSVVTLDGSGSSDPDNDPLTYSWAFLSRAPNSTAIIVPFNSVSPKFLADTPGTYVVQVMVNDGISNSNPATVSITAGAPAILAISLSPATLGLATNAPGALTLTLSDPAGPGGQIVNLVSSNGGAATVPATVNLPQGSTTANVPLTPTGAGSATITAAATGYTPGTALVSVANVKIILGPSPLNMGNTQSSTLAVTLSSPAGTGGQLINLTSSNTNAATVPPTVTIPQGSATANVIVTPGNAGSTIITASAESGFISATATVNVANITQIILPANVTVGPAQTVSFPLTLASPAPPGGVFISLVSSDTTKLTVSPANFLIPAGALAPLSTPKLTGIDFGPVTLTASAYGLTPSTQQVRVAATLTLFPGSLTMSVNTRQYSTAVLSAPAPASGLTLSVRSENSGVTTVPASITFAPGATTAVVPVFAIGAGSTVIHASALPNINEATANVTVH